MTLKKLFAALAGVALLATPMSAVAAPAPVGLPSKSFNDTYIVTLKPGASPKAEARQAQRMGGSVSFVYESALQGYAVKMNQSQLAGLSRNPNIAAIEADQVVTLNSTETQTGATWGLDRIDQVDRPLNGSYSYVANGLGIRAYIIDTGIRPSHSEFGGRVVSGYTAILDGNGTNDCNGHGTHVAGTVGGAKHGVAKQVTLVPVRVLGCDGSGTWSGVIAGVDWVRNNSNGNVAVANLSLGGGASSSVDTAVRNLADSGVVTVVAAGNSNANACNYSPAREPMAVTVGATTSSDSRSSFSNFGRCLDLFAPGTSITAAWHTGDLAERTISGTSMAAPHVAGVAALYLSAVAGSTAREAETWIQSNASTGKISSAGRQSPNLLLYSLGALPTPPESDPEPEPSPEPSPEPTPEPSPEPTPTDPVDEPLTAPTNLSASQSGSTVNVSWTNPTGTITRIEVEARDNRGNLTASSTLLSTATAWSFAAAGKTNYDITVRVVNDTSSAQTTLRFRTR
jgi:subtilisin family serine protease